MDDGGNSGDYGKWQDSYFTISPVGATNVILNFSHFNVEPGSGSTCNFDYLEVYDGNSTSSPLIGRYCNTIPPPTSITSTTGHITIKFHTDGGAELSGFKIDWTCNAWSSPYPLAKFITSDTTPCAKQAVTFTNQSFNATSYLWTFPGGIPATSTAINPVITYNTPGTYNVTLVAINSAGNDTIIKSTHIVVPVVCPIILPAGGNAPTQIACRGKLIDDGGLTGNYSPNQTTYVTIAPTGAVFVRLDFTAFDVEADGCIYDYMEIYDGATTASPLIGKYCNTTLPPNPLISSGNAVTIKFYADGGLELDGFEIDWTCSLAGLTELDKINKINIYPNPSTDFVNLEVDFNIANSLNIRVIDMLGKTHYQNISEKKAIQFTDKIDVSNLVKGLYIIYVNGKANKFIKQ